MRAKDLTLQLLTFSKGGEPIKERAQITDIITESSEFALRGSKSSIRYNFPKDIYDVFVDKGQISRVVHNLIINADQAMPNGGILYLSAQNIDICANNTINLLPGKFVKFSIQDAGIGIDEKHIKNIFDPYFSTKQKGSGLGLSICYSIIKKHGGAIYVSSKLGEGSTFEVYLPICQGEKACAPTLNEETEMRNGSGKILFMDDEQMLHNVAAEILENFGYTVDFAFDGKEAIQKYRESFLDGTPYDVVVMDLTIPGGIGGQEAVAKVLEINKFAKVIVSSGYSNDKVLADFQKYGFKAIITKPFQISDFIQTIKRVIESDIPLKER